MRKEVMNCTKCALSRSRKNAVFGEGSLTAEVMLIGEAPGYYEDLEGKPFVGAAGKFLDELLSISGLNRASIFLTNVVKCRPPKNREPTEQEVASCRLYLDGQLELIGPKLVVTLGNIASSGLLSEFGLESGPMARIHAKAFEVSTPKGPMRMVPMYHPATALYQQPIAETMRNDWAKLREMIGGGKSLLDRETT